MNGNTHFLPDSRLHDQDFGTIMGNWPLPDGTTVRCEMCPVWCANCGKMYGYVPKENTTFGFYLCAKCHEAYGDVAGMFAVPDDEFRAAVHHEMRSRFGRILSDLEVAYYKERQELGTALTKLESESPYPVPS